MKPVSLFIPAYNEEGIIFENTERLIGYLCGLDIDFEIILIDNGSKDKTAEIGKRLEGIYRQVRFFKIPERGVGLAFKKAVLNAKNEHIICFDMDLSTDLSFIPEANRLLEDHVIVIGSKRMGKEERKPIRRFAGRFYIFLTRVISGIPVSDYSIGAKAIRKSFVLSHLHLIDRHTHYVFSLCRAAIRENQRIIEIPVFCKDERGSHFNLVQEGLYRFYMLLKTSFSHD